MNVLIVAEKPSFAYAIMASLQRVRPWPGARVTIIPTIMTGLYRFDYPERLHAPDFPFVGNVRKCPGRSMLGSSDAPWFVWRGVCGDTAAEWASSAVREHEDLSPGHGSSCGFLRSGTWGRRLLDPAGLRVALRDLILGSDVVVKITDDYHRGSVAFLDVISCGGSDTAHLADYRQGRGPRFSGGPEILDTKLRSLEDAAIDQMVVDLSPGRAHTSDDQGRVFLWCTGSADERYGLGKDFFDYNWRINGSALLAAPLRRAGIPGRIMSYGQEVQATNLLSKYSLLLLQSLAFDRGHAGWSEGEVIQCMTGWKGTGKYTPGPWDSTFGSYASRGLILENLIALGLLTRETGRGILVSEAGHRFVSLLPKGAYDPDLPFRLHAWCSDWPNARPAVEAYIRRFFGGIKRSNGMTDLAQQDVTVFDAARLLVEAYDGVEAAADAAQISPQVLTSILQERGATPSQMRAVRLAGDRTSRTFSPPPKP